MAEWAWIKELGSAAAVVAAVLLFTRYLVMRDKRDKQERETTGQERAAERAAYMTLIGNHIEHNRQSQENLAAATNRLTDILNNDRAKCPLTSNEPPFVLHVERREIS